MENDSTITKHDQREWLTQASHQPRGVGRATWGKTGGGGKERWVGARPCTWRWSFPGSEEACCWTAAGSRICPVGLTNTFCALGHHAAALCNICIAGMPPHTISVFSVARVFSRWVDLKACSWLSVWQIHCNKVIAWCLRVCARVSRLSANTHCHCELLRKWQSA